MASGGARGSAARAGAPSATAGAAAAATGGPLDALRQHPQINQLRHLIQTTPEALPQVISMIGNASPDMLTAINDNREAFIAMMNVGVLWRRRQHTWSSTTSCMAVLH